jgi:hypothetical protein
MAAIWPSIISTAKKSNSRHVRLWLVCLLLACGMFASRPARGCPFCTALEPTLAQRRAASDVTLLAEVETASAGGSARLKVHQVLSGDETLMAQSELSAPLNLAVQPGTLVMLFGNDTADGEREWHAVVVDETSAAYLARAPGADLPAAERLVYFARFLEHPNKLVAEDSYLEFGHAPFDVVAEVSPRFDMEQVRTWLTAPEVPGHRKGFHGLLLGLAREDGDKTANAALLRKLILEPEDDFRAGFDGILGGYMLLEALPGLELIESRYLSDTKAAVGDVRHAQTALRFYHEYGRAIPKERICVATRHLLARPEFAASAIIDLARWNDWQPLEVIAGLYAEPAYAEPTIRRAIVGYLLACPEPNGRQALADLRSVDPAGVAEAEQLLSRTGAVPQAQ